MKRLLLVALLLAPLPAAAQRASLADHLEQALDIDAAFRSLAAQRDAVAARRALTRSPIPGSPVVGGDFRSDLRGPGQSRELIIDLAAPVWLPGQRGAYGNTVQTGVAEFEARLLLRRLEVAGLLRDAWWTAAAAARDVRVARDRLTTSRDIARDVQRRVELGDIPYTDACSRGTRIWRRSSACRRRRRRSSPPAPPTARSPPAPSPTCRPSARPARCACTRRWSRRRPASPRRRRRCALSRRRPATTRSSASSAATRKGG